MPEAQQMEEDRPRSPGISLAPVLSIVVTLAVLPLFLFAVFVFSEFADRARDRAESGLVESARGVARAIDVEFGVAIAALTVLKSSIPLATDDLAAFERRLINTDIGSGKGFVLLDAAGTQVISTNKNSSASFKNINIDDVKREFVTKNIYISNVLKAEGSKQPFVLISVPILRNGALKWVLGLFLSSNDFSYLVRQPGVPQDWIVSIVDRRGTHIRRSHLNSEYAGLPLVPELVRHIENGGSGVLRNNSHEGIRLISTVQYAPISGWAVAMGLPVAVLEAPMWNTLYAFFLFGAVLLVGALLLAVFSARMLTKAFSALVKSAESLAREEHVAPAHSAIREANEVILAMRDASLRLADRSQALRNLNSSLEATVDQRTRALVDEMKQREESEAQLRQLQKMEAIGNLTGGIAHDFNNMLAIIIGSLDLARKKLDRGESDLGKSLERAIEGADNAAKLTSKLLAFSRQQALSPEPVDCNRMIADMSDLLRRTLPENIEIETVLAGGLWQTKADVTGLENAILNIAVNARDAMPEGGKLTLETTNARLDDSYAYGHTDVLAGQYVLVAITDTGVGIPAESLERVFEPFYTTKGAGHGTGLGLSQVHGFVKQSGGHITIYSEEGHGTAVKIYLPRLMASVESQAGPAPYTQALPVSQNKETILVVEDDPSVREATVEMLQDLGYVTLDAENGETALRLLEQHPEVVLLMTDVVMPGMNGRQLADEAGRRRSNLPILFTTGYTTNAIVHQGVLDPGTMLLNKPFSYEALAQKIADILSQRV